MLTFAPGMQLLALVGLAAAAAPIVIHLFNRRRFREIEWAAMEFLLEAASRSRSLLHLRDLLLLLLRTAAVACFALAVARPFFTTRPGAAAGAGPVHAILVVDNSLSMGRMRLDGRTLLDAADGTYTATVEVDGRKVQVRTGDGVHFTPEGADFVGRALLAELDAQCRLKAQSVPNSRQVVVETQGSNAYPGSTAGSAATTVPGPTTAPTTTPTTVPATVAPTTVPTTATPVTTTVGR